METQTIFINGRPTHCAHCGCQILEGQFFCARCGHKVGSFPNQEPEVQAPKKRSKKLLIIILCAAAAVALALAAFFLLRTPQAEYIRFEERRVTVVMDESAQLNVRLEPQRADVADLSWSSSDESIAVVSVDGRITGKNIGTCTVTAASKKADADCTITVRAPYVERISLPEELVVAIDETLQPECRFSPSNAAADEIRWDSSDKYVATVSHNGVIQPRHLGTCTITVTADGKTASCQLTVRGPYVKDILLEDESSQVPVGETIALAFTISPEDADPEGLVWVSSDESVATVSPAGEVTGVSLGTCTIIASADDASASCELTVRGAYVEQLTLSSASQYIRKGKSAALSCKIGPAEAKDANLTWSSSDESVATVDEDGNITAVDVGSCIISVSADGIAAKCDITVWDMPAEEEAILGNWVGLNVLDANGKEYIGNRVFKTAGSIAIYNDKSGVLILNDSETAFHWNYTKTSGGVFLYSADDGCSMTYDPSSDILTFSTSKYTMRFTR